MIKLQVTSTCKTNFCYTENTSPVLCFNYGEWTNNVKSLVLRPLKVTYKPFYPVCGTFGGSGYAYEANLSKNGDK